MGFIPDKEISLSYSGLTYGYSSKSCTFLAPTSRYTFFRPSPLSISGLGTLNGQTGYTTDSFPSDNLKDSTTFLVLCSCIVLVLQETNVESIACPLSWSWRGSEVVPGTSASGLDRSSA